MVDSRTAPAVGTSDRRHAAQRHRRDRRCRLAGRRARHAVRPKASACRSSRLARGRSTVENAVGRAAAGLAVGHADGRPRSTPGSTSRPTTASASPGRSLRPPSSGTGSAPPPPARGRRRMADAPSTPQARHGCGSDLTPGDSAGVSGSARGLGAAAALRPASEDHVVSLLAGLPAVPGRSRDRETALTASKGGSRTAAGGSMTTRSLSFAVPLGRPRRSTACGWGRAFHVPHPRCIRLAAHASSPRPNSPGPSRLFGRRDIVDGCPTPSPRRVGAPVAHVPEALGRAQPADIECTPHSRGE